MFPASRKPLRLLSFVLAGVLTAATLGALALAGAYAWVAPDLPSIDSLRQVQLQVPLRVYSTEGKLIAEFGEKRRTPVAFEDAPPLVIQAFLSAEDDRFFEHPGVDYQGLIRAALHLLRTGEKGQGGSTITMQVARNFFLSSEKTYVRKLSEIFLALKIERELTKEEILELYLNKIYLGSRAYGVRAAAQVYYGKSLDELTLPEVAMIAGLPKAPSRYNPLADPTRAVARRNYVLGRMHELGFIETDEYVAALEAPVTALYHGQPLEVDAPYVAEMVRGALVERFGVDAYTNGYKVVTTINADLQQAANEALRAGLMDYDRRHGYRGAEQTVDLEQVPDAESRARLLDDLPVIGGLRPALVLEVQERSAVVEVRDIGTVPLEWPAMEWARPYIDENRRGAEPKQAADVLSPGDIVRVYPDGEEGGWVLSQVPAVAGALVSLSPRDGAVRALVGGFDYYQSKFNRATQARRQPGSSFKPFIYSAALESGFTPASLINDAPVVFEDPSLEATWRPENYSGRFYGPTRLREALVHSRNLVSIRLLRAVGIKAAVEHALRFGFDPKALPRNLSLALGSGTLTPLELARGYAVFANGGYEGEPYFIARIEDHLDTVLYQANPAVACDDCEPGAGREAGAAPDELQRVDAAVQDSGDGSADASSSIELPRYARRVLPAPNAYLMQSMMRDVVRRGTARRAMQLGRGDLAGKTGTTNDLRDAWFSGFNLDLVTTAWVGFDQLKPLGSRETGGRAALPIWMQFMGAALEGVPERAMKQPAGMVTVRIDAESGLLAGGDSGEAVFETFRSDLVPKRVADAQPPGGTTESGGGRADPEQIF